MVSNLSILLIASCCLFLWVGSSLTEGLMFKATTPLFTYRHGRYVRDKDAILFDWSGFIISTQFVYKQDVNASMNTLNAVVHFKSHRNTYNVYLWRLNENNERVQLIQQSLLACNLTAEHFEVNFNWPKDLNSQSYTVQLELEKRTEAHLGIVYFYGITFTQSIEPVKSSNLKSRGNRDLKMEFIGDSITCGYGNLGKRPCGFSPLTEDVHESFVEKTARYLNASDIHVQCYSGKGMVRNHGDKNTTSIDPLPVYYPRTLANDPNILWNFQKTFIPDIVVITLGTNDFSTSPRPSFEEFSNAYQKFLDFVFLQYGPIKGPSFKVVMVSLVTFDNYGDYIQQVAERQKGYGTNLFFANLRDLLRNFTPEDKGCGIHPSVLGDEKMAKMLSAFIATNVLN